MGNFSNKGLAGKITGYARKIIGLRIPVYASHAGFFIVLSLFPSLILLVSLVRYAGLEAGHLVGLLEGVIPDALLPGAENLIYNTYYSISGTLVSLSAITALWSAGRGIQGLLTGLNAVYGVTESRGYVRTRGMSMLYTVLFLLVLLLTLVLHVFGTTLLRLLPAGESLFWDFLTEVVDLRFFLLLIVQTGVFTAMFMVLPNRKNRFRESLPGALLASCGWLVFSDLYSWYVENFTRYSNVFGSVYGVALSMLWLYCCLCIVFYGGVLNSYLQNN